MAVIHYHEQVQRPISQGKRPVGWSPEKTRFQLPRVLSVWSYPGQLWFLKLWEVVAHVKYSLSGKLSRNPVPRILTGGGHVSAHSAPTCQNPQHPEGKQAVGINHTVCSWGTTSRPFQGRVGIFQNPSSQMPAKGTFQAGLPKNNNLRPAVLILFCTMPFESKAISWLKCV